MTGVRVGLDVMSDEQKQALRTTLQGGREARQISFAQPGSLTRVYAIASGKGGVGKSSMTVNLAVAMAQVGLTVGVVDADVYGHSMPRMLGIATPPAVVDGMIVPPEAYGVKVVSTGMFVEDNRPIAWRGPMLHKALEQLLADVYWGDLDILLLDLPPGTGDIAISTAQLLPSAEIIVVTTPQLAAARSPSGPARSPLQTKQRLAGVIENMAGLPCPHCGEMIDVFGAGGGQRSPTASPTSSAPRCRCSARCRSTRGCARAATPADRSCSPTRTPTPRWRCGRSPRRSAQRPVGWPGARCH